MYSSAVGLFPQYPLFFENETDVLQFLQNNGFDKSYQRIFKTKTENNKSEIAWYYNSEDPMDERDWAWSEGHAE
jgi:hypothetical protein